MRDRNDYVFVRIDVDIWYGKSATNGDICPACAKEVLRGILNKPNG